MNKDPNFDFYSFHFDAPAEKGPRLNHADELPPLSSVGDENAAASVAAIEAGKARRRTARRAFSRVGWAFIVLMVAANVGAAIVALTIQTFFPSLVDASWYSLVVGTLPMYVLGTALFALTLIGAPTRRPERSRIGFGGFFAFFVASFTLMIAGNLLGNGLMSALSQLLQYDFSFALEQALGAEVWLTALFLVVLAPLFEELIFRKLLIDRLLPHGEAGAVLVSALLFGLFHGNFYQFFYAAAVGALLALLYLRTGKWGLCALLHGLFNLIGGLVPTLLQQHLDMDLIANATDMAQIMDYLNENAVTFSLFVGYQLLLYLLAFVGLIVLIVCRRKYFKAQPLTGELPRRGRGAVVLGNVGMVLALLFSIGYFALNLILSAVV